MALTWNNVNLYSEKKKEKKYITILDFTFYLFICFIESG